jgi:hypothetical protein
MGNSRKPYLSFLRIRDGGRQTCLKAGLQRRVRASVARSVFHNFYDFPNHFSYFRVSKMAGFVKNDALICRKQTVWSYIALLSEATDLEILILERDCIAVSDPLTRYLTRDHFLLRPLLLGLVVSWLGSNPKMEMGQPPHRPSQIFPSFVFFGSQPVFLKRGFA